MRVEMLFWGLFVFSRITSLTGARRFSNPHRAHEKHAARSDPALKKHLGFFSFHKRPFVQQSLLFFMA